jgi:hypothetical protein
VTSKATAAVDPYAQNPTMYIGETHSGRLCRLAWLDGEVGWRLTEHSFLNLSEVAPPLQETVIQCNTAIRSTGSRYRPPGHLMQFLRAL